MWRKIKEDAWQAPVVVGPEIMKEFALAPTALGFIGLPATAFEAASL